MSEQQAESGGAEAEQAQHALRMLDMISGFWVTQILRSTAELSLADHVADGATTAEEIAEREGSAPATTYRLLRAAASLGLFSDAGDRRFRVTPLGSLLRKGVPGSLRELAMSQGAPLLWQSSLVLPEAVRKGSTQMHAAPGLGLTEGQNAFDYFGAHPEEGALFAASMANATGLITQDVAGAVGLDGVSLAVDVGGSTGALMHTLMQGAPHLRGVVLDLPHVVTDAQRTAEKAGLANRCTAVAGDFFEEVPAADLYLLKMILHDWDDAACLTILRNCRAAARPGARAVVVEAVVGATGEPSFAAVLDINMLASTTGQERDLDEFDALYAASGWRRTRTVPTRTPQVIQELEAV